MKFRMPSFGVSDNMNDIEIIQELIHPKAIIQPTQGKYPEKLKAKLSEAKKPDSFIIIAGLPENSIIFHVDDCFPEPNKIFAGTRGECCRSDYIIVVEENNALKIVLIELKGQGDDSAHIKNQLRGSQSFFEYCKAILHIFWQYKITSNCIYHYVSCKRTSEKRPTKYDPKVPANTSVETMLTLKGNGTFRFNQLIAKK